MASCSITNKHHRTVPVRVRERERKREKKEREGEGEFKIGSVEEVLGRISQHCVSFSSSGVQQTSTLQEKKRYI